MFSEKSFFLFVFAFALGLVRLHGVTGEFFQAVAHLYVGGLFGAYFATGEKYPLILASVLSFLEAVCFFYGIGR